MKRSRFQVWRMSAVGAIAALAVACATESEPDEDESEADGELAASYKVQIKSRMLSVIGNNADSKLALRLGATAATLVVDVGDDGSADFELDRSRFERIVVDGGGGNDVLRVDESGGPFTDQEQVTLQGGAGNDTLVGGIGVETLVGGTGNDVLDGRFGNDSIVAGPGDDTIVWVPGSGSDVVEGNDGFDTFDMRMGGANEQVALAAVGDHVRLTRDVASIVLDLHAVDRIAIATAGGSDGVTIGDLAPALVAEVDVDVGSPLGGPDGAADTIVVSGTTGPDAVGIALDGAALVATGLATEVRVTSGEPALDRLVIAGDASDRVNVDGSDGPDAMLAIPDGAGVLYDGGGYHTLVAPAAPIAVTVRGLAGDDTITAGSVSAPLAIDGGDGADQITGGAGADLLIGGPGADRIDGRLGADTVQLGDGDDIAGWSPGDASDVIDGGAGSDTLVFTGANVGETLDLHATGSHLVLTRDIGTVSLDLAALERVEVRARGGADRLTVHALAGTSAIAVSVDLASSDGLGDAQADTVVLDGATAIDVTGDGATVIADGLGATVRVANGEPALDRLAVTGGVVTVHGSPGPDAMAVFADAGGPAYDGGGFGVLVAPAAGLAVAMRGEAGDDTITASASVTVPLVLDGGDGNDRLVGGSGADRLIGGPGNDVIEGRQGADSVQLGDGDDTAMWNPGDGSDVIEGELGNDALVMQGANVDETFDLRAAGSRVTLLRSIASIALDLGGLERIAIRARGGSDTLFVGDLTGTPVTDVELALSPDGSALTDGVIDTVHVSGSATDDAIAITGAPGVVTVSGLPATVRVTQPDAFDQLVVHGLGGSDTFAAAGVEGVMTLSTVQD